MVAQAMMRTYGVIQTFRFAEGIKRVVNFDFFSVLTYLTAYVRNMLWELPTYINIIMNITIDYCTYTSITLNNILFINMHLQDIRWPRYVTREIKREMQLVMTRSALPYYYRDRTWHNYWLSSTLNNILFFNCSWYLD